MEDWKYPYLAGVIDGEGSLHIEHYNGRYVPVIEVGTVDNILWKFLKNNFGGNVRERIKKDGHRNVHVWRLKGYNNILNLLRNVLPYLTIKKEKAEVMITFIESRIKTLGETNISYKKSEIDLYELLCHLNS